MYEHFKQAKKTVISGFQKAHIAEAVKEAAELQKLCENPFENIDMVGV